MMPLDLDPIAHKRKKSDLCSIPGNLLIEVLDIFIFLLNFKDTQSDMSQGLIQKYLFILYMRLYLFII
jgi:hypothetical protein